MKIRSYECFDECMRIASMDFYRVLYHPTWEEAGRRLRILEIDNPEQYNEWHKRWLREKLQR